MRAGNSSFYYRNGNSYSKITPSFTIKSVDQTITYVTSTTGTIHKYNSGTNAFDLFYTPSNSSAFNSIKSYNDRLIVNDSSSNGAWVEAFLIEGSSLSSVFRYEHTNFSGHPTIETCPDLSQVLVNGVESEVVFYTYFNGQTNVTYNYSRYTQKLDFYSLDYSAKTYS